MVKTLQKALEEVSALPAEDQEHIGKKLLSHVEKLRQLREALNKGVRSLERGDGKPFDIQAFLKLKRNEGS